ncbi:MAG: SsrA-binding protein SmpB [Candidatus Wildermuthbacteria bacterium]|nr:SsrA-binding protein SmpB [Candidatus Wildermuthbacteria bacterium]
MTDFAENRKAYFNYEILEKFEAGIVLNGQEVKSIKLGRAQLAGSYIVPRGNELFLVGVTIPPYQPRNALSSYDPQRSRKLLLHKKELSYLMGKAKERGLTLVSLRLYNKNAQIKIEFALAKGKKQYDKRETIRRREAEREMKRALRAS